MQSDIIKCIDCNKDFEITEGERDFILSKVDAEGRAFSLPKRCKPCRDKKKARFAGYNRRELN